MISKGIGCFSQKAGLKDEVESPPSSPLVDLVEDVLLVVDADSEDIGKGSFSRHFVRKVARK